MSEAPATVVETTTDSEGACPSFIAKRSSDDVQVHDGFIKIGCLHLFKGYADDDDKDYLHLCGVEEIDELISTLTALRQSVEDSL